MGRFTSMRLHAELETDRRKHALEGRQLSVAVLSSFAEPVGLRVKITDDARNSKQGLK